MTIIQKHLGILWQYCRDEPALANNGNTIEFNEDNTDTNMFKLKEKITGQRGNTGTKMLKK